MTLLQGGITSYGNGVPNIFTHNDVVSGKDGKFVFERVVPGRVLVARGFTRTVNDGALEVGSARRQPVFVKPGQTLNLQLGGSGRAITGKLLPAIESDEETRWSFASILIQREFEFPARPARAVKEDPQRWQARVEEWKKSPAGIEYERMKKRENESPLFDASVSPDGTFRVDDMPQGKYKMRIRFSQHSAGQLPDYRFEIEDDTLENPLELGEIQLLPSLR